MQQHEEYQYVNLIREILENGSDEMTRNGKVRSIFGYSMRFSLRDGTMPILTTKKTAWKTCLKELLWFIRGETDNKILNNEGVHIWDGNATKEFMQSRGLDHYPEGILGPLYGYQWRNFNAPYNEETGKPMETNAGHDQLQNIINELKNPATRCSRRLIMTAWNPCQLDKMALPPCHILCQFNVHDGNKLSCAMYQRSGDVGLGVPFNIASYSFLTHILAKHCGLVADSFVYFLGNAHIYEEHLESLKEHFVRLPYTFPKIEITQQHKNINDYIVENIKFTQDYVCHPAIVMKMIA